MFREYMHVEKWGNDPVEGIHLGETYVFPKLDGTNSSLWFNEESCVLHGGSRHRHLSLDQDNQGFLAHAYQDERYYPFFTANPRLRLYGEWLIPHTLKTYRPDVWNKFWIFDVYNDEAQEYLSYETYQPLLEAAKLDYIPPLAIVKAGDTDKFVRLLESNTLFITDGKGIGEGIVIKNYQFYNKFQQQVWAKIIASEFKEQHHRTMGPPEVGGTLCEEAIAVTFVTQALCDKTLAKIKNEKNGWESKYIAELLGRIWYDFINEEMWNILKDKKNKTINFPTLRHFVNREVKLKLPEVF